MDKTDSNWNLTSKTIDGLRFPLVVMVVFIHSFGGGEKIEANLSNVYSLNSIDFLYFIRVAFSRVIPNVAVPTFFLISGYLFFNKIETFNKTIYWQKLKKRIHTLLIPYVLWNIICLLSPILYHFIAWWHDSRHYSMMIDYVTSVDWLRWIWDFSFVNTYGVTNEMGLVYDKTYPINGPLWYVRDLMVLCLVSPVIYVITKKLGVVFILAASLLYLFGIWPNIHGLGVSGFFFFSVGSYFALYRVSIVSVFRKVEFTCYFMAIFLLLLLIPNNNAYIVGAINLSDIYVIIGVVSIFNLASRLFLSETIVPNRWLTNSVFLVFAFHQTFLPIYLSQLVYPYKESGVSSLYEYLLTPFLKIVICLITYWILEKGAPKVLKILTGNRG